jgi:outer membrane protein assembly factor BamA
LIFTVANGCFDGTKEYQRMAIKIVWYDALCLLLFFLPLFAGNGAQRQSMIAVVPLAFYTPETGFAGGGAVIVITNMEPEDPIAKPDQLNMIAYYTQKHQYVLDATTERYYQRNALRVYVSGNYKKFPDRFWGIGKQTIDNAEEDYTQAECTLYGNPMWTISRFLRVGPYYRFSHFKVTDTEEDGKLGDGTITGSERARVSGFGAELSWDSRDNIFYPLQGTFAQLRYLYYHTAWGSSEEFQQAELDCRYYLRTVREQVIAIQCRTTVSKGNVPFQLLPRLGGSTIMRGMHDGRFRDKHCLAVQSEYRIPLFWRFGAVLFGSAGQVFSGREEFGWSDFKTAGGVGGRCSIMEGQRINCRLDVAFHEGKMALYFKYQEAF